MAQPTPTGWEALCGVPGQGPDLWVLRKGPDDKHELTKFGFEGEFDWRDWVVFARRILEQDGK